MPPLLETLAAELERPRELLSQVAKHVAGTYGIPRDAMGPFVLNELPKLEDYEIDLILSPVFTPTLRDQAVFAEQLGMESVPSVQWLGLIQQLAARPTRAQLITEGGQSYPVLLREVTIERYVNRLCLDGVIPEALFKLLTHLPPPADRPLLKAMARRPIWQSEFRRQILTRYLLTCGGNEQYRIEDALELLKIVETYQPAGLADLLAHIPHWQQVLHHEINLAVNPKAFFNERIQELHGGGRDQRHKDDLRVSTKEREIAFLDRLKQALTD